MAPLTLRTAERRKAKMRVAILGPSGAGKTYSALLLARGLATAWDKVALIDSENGSGDLYSDLGPYNVITLERFSPRDYIEAINACEAAGMEAVVVDSASHEWEWCKAEVDRIKATTKNDYTAWGPVGKLHDEFLRKLNTSSVHMVECARTKQDYILVDKNGKKVPEKVGMAAVQRDGFEYEFTVVFELDMGHKAFATKDRTRLFVDKEAQAITPETGKALLNWASTGKEPEKKVETQDADGKPDWDVDEKLAFDEEAAARLSAAVGKFKTADALLATAEAKYKLTEKDRADIRSAFDKAAKPQEQAQVEEAPAKKKPGLTPMGVVQAEWLNHALPASVLKNRNDNASGLLVYARAALGMAEDAKFDLSMLTDETAKTVAEYVKANNQNMIDPK